MTIQQRRRRRLAIIALILLAGIGASAGLYAHRQHRAEVASQEHRARGLAAAKVRDSATVLDELGAYLRRHKDDAEALYAYAVARRSIVAPRGGHLIESIGVLQRVIGLEPDHEEARRDLLDLYSTCGYSHETIDLADSILRDHSDDADAWRAKAVALARMRRLSEAQEAAEKCLALKPFDVRAAVLLLDVRQQQGAPGAQLIESARAHRKQHPQSPVADLREAYANRLAGNMAVSIELLRAAAKKPAIDEAYLVMLVMLLDEARLGDESMAILEKSSLIGVSDPIRVELARRLWEANRFKEIDERFGAVDPSRRDSSDVLLGLRAASLYELGRRDEAEAIRVALAGRGAESIGGAWAAVLGAAYGPRQGQARAVIAATTDALAADPSNAYFAYLQGAAWWSVGETDLAMSSWKTSIKHRPNWMTPRIGYVHALLGAGQAELAQREARLAIERAPQRVDVIAAWVVAHAATLTPDNLERAQQLLPAAAAVQRAAPYEPRTLPLYIALLAQCGKTDVAAQRLRQVLVKAPALDESVWLQLANISETYGLKLEAACFDHLQKVNGVTPGLTLARATDLAAQGKADAGKRLMMTAARSGSARHALAWQVAIGKYLDQTNDAAAMGHWIALADANAQDERVQNWALQARCVQRDRAAQDRLIERLRALSGPQAVTWRLARAQRLLADGGQGAAEAAALLQGVVAEAPNSLPAQVMLARSLDHMNLDSKAAAQIAAAARAQPQSIELAMEAARMLQSQQDFTGARVHLLRVAERSDLDALTAARLAAMLARQGEDAVAVKVLDAMAKTSPLSEKQLLLLGALGRRLGEKERVAAAIKQLMSAPTAAGIEFAADYHAATGDLAEARRDLARLEGIDIGEVDRAILLAEFEQRHGTAAAALAQWERAVAADRTRVAAHRGLIAHHVRAQDARRAGGALEAARQALPADKGIQDLSRRKDVIEWAAAQPLLQPLVLTMVLNDSALSGAGDALDIIRGMGAENQTASLARLRDVSQSGLHELPLVTVTVQLHVLHGEAEAVLPLAAAAMAAHPTAWEVAWVRSEALGAAGRWDEAMATAYEWRRRSITDPLPADMMIAEAQFRLNRPAESLRQLSAHMARAKADPKRYGDVLWSCARAQVATGQIDAAVELLTPVWGESSVWRVRAVDLALQSGLASSVATGWLEHVTRVMPVDAVVERTRLATAWLELGSRFRSAEARHRADQLLGELVKLPAATAEQWFLVGLLREQQADTPRAERAYRKALELSPGMAVASNNLAMILAASEDTLNDALELAVSAARAAPNAPGFLDTLAHIQHRMGRHEEAVASVRRAVELQPDNPKWRDHLATLLASRDGVTPGR